MISIVFLGVTSMYLSILKGGRMKALNTNKGLCTKCIAPVLIYQKSRA